MGLDDSLAPAAKGVMMQPKESFKNKFVFWYNTLKLK